MPVKNQVFICLHLQNKTSQKPVWFKEGREISYGFYNVKGIWGLSKALAIKGLSGEPGEGKDG